MRHARFHQALLLSILLLAGCAAAPGETPNEMNAESELMTERILFAQAYIAADYDEVWRRFTQADAYAEWHSAPCLEFGAAVGDRVAWGTPDQTVYQGTVERLDKGQGLTHTFQFVGFGFEEPPSPVAIDIVPRGATVLVTIRHDCTDAPRTAEMITEVGWLKSLSRLKTLLESGHPMPWPEP